MRAIAVILVVAYHAWPAAIPGGYIGVDVFFVISGFIITRQIYAEMESGSFSYTAFLARRVRRLLPAAFVCSVLVCIGAIAWLSPPDLVDFAKSLISTWMMSANFFFLKTSGYFSGPSEQKPLLHMWSLAVEDQFYLTWPLVLALIHKYVDWRKGVTIVIPLIALASLIHAALNMSGKPDYVFYSPLTRAFELLTGCWIALAVAKERLTRGAAWHGVLGLIGIALVIVASLPSRQGEQSSWWLAVVPAVVGTALAVYAGLRGPNVLSRLLSAPPLVFVGQVSYSWYLYHWPFLSLSRHVLQRAPDDAEALFLVLAALVAATLSMIYVERPFREKTISFRRASMGTAAAGLSLSIVAAVLLAGRGLPWRLEPQVANLYNSLAMGNTFRSACDGVANAFRNDSKCNFGSHKAGGVFDIVIVGDSNADHYVPMIGVLAKEAGLSGRQVTQSTCAPLIGTRQNRGEAGETNRAELCANYHAAILRFIDAHPELKVVVMGAVWSSWQTGLATNSIAEALGIGPMRSDKFDDYLDPTINLIRKRGIKVVLLGQIPHLAQFDMRCFVAAARKGATDGACATPFAHSEAQLANPRAKFRSLAESDQAIRFLDPSRFLCSPEACSPFQENLFLYRDFGHLNVQGAHFLAKKFGNDRLWQ